MREQASMWPTTSEPVIEDYEYALSSYDEPGFRRRPKRLAMRTDVLAGVVGAAFVLGIAAGFGLAWLVDD